MKSLKNIVKNTMIAMSLFTIGAQVAPAIGLNLVEPIVAEASISDIKIGFDEEGKFDVSGGGTEYTSDTDAWNGFLAKYKNFIVGFTGVVTATMLLLLVIGFGRLGTTAHSGSDRAKATTGLIVLAIATAGLGAVTFFFAFFLNGLR